RVGFPFPIAGRRIKRVDAPPYAVAFAAGRSDEHQPVPRNRGGGDGFTFFRIRKMRAPQLLAARGVVGQYVAVTGATEQPAVEIGRATVDARRRRGARVTHAPLCLTRRRVDGEDFSVGGDVQRAADDERPRLEIDVHVEVVDAQLLQS